MTAVKKSIQESFLAFGQLVKRNLKLFFLDKAGVFFSMLAPLIVLLLYILFLGDLQVQNVVNSVPIGIPLNEKAVKAYVDSWMMAGVLSISCITVSLGANTVMILDKTKGVLNDFISSPVKRWVINASYFMSNFLTTVVITGVTYIICLVYLAISGGWYLTFLNVLLIFTTIILSSASATLMTVLICGFLRTEAAFSGLIGIMSAVIGFFIGAYMPMSIMPKGLQYISGLIPGTHSAGLFRTYLMSGALENLGKGMPQELLNSLSEIFSMKINLFGTSVGPAIMYAFLGGSILLFGILGYFISFNKKARK
jgi:multidrug/hemolysin transport system permease protein